VTGFAVRVASTAEAVDLLPDVDDYFLVDLRFDSGVRCFDDGRVAFGESKLLVRLKREEARVGLIFEQVERYAFSQDHVMESVTVQESRGLLDVAILGLRVRCFGFSVLMNPAADFATDATGAETTETTETTPTKH
jgi:hypothetical protein